MRKSVCVTFYVVVVLSIKHQSEENGKPIYSLYIFNKF
jgi:hypothetical protein